MAGGLVEQRVGDHCCSSISLLDLDSSLPTMTFPTISQNSFSSLLSAAQQGTLEPASGKVFLSQVFTVQKPDLTTLLLVVDLTCLNHFMDPRWFRMLTVAQVCLALHPGAWLTVLNLRNAYWHLLVAPRFKCFQGIQVRETVLQFIVLLFSLNITSYVFTKVIKPVAKVLGN